MSLESNTPLADALETASITLVTIIAPITLSDALLNDLRDIGVTGYTTWKVDGFGTHGTREFGLNDEPNIHIDTLVSAEIARAILARMNTRSAVDGLVAYAREVEAVPGRHF
jgi:nitrogen regulatory protein PII